MDEIQRAQHDIRFKGLVIEYRNGNKEALTELVVLCEPLVGYMSRKYYNLAMLKNIPFEDLKQECYVGLLGAINRFPTNIQNNSFRSYVCSAMNHQVLMYFRNNSNRIVKRDASKGHAEFESMDKVQTSFAELEDPIQGDLFDSVINDIDREIQKKNIQKMLNDILNQDNDITILRDMYGLDGKTYSMYEICTKYNLSLKELMFKERLMVLKIQHSRKLEKYIEILDYCSQAAYKYSFQRFKDTRISSTEFLAMKHIEYEEKNKTLENQVGEAV